MYYTISLLFAGLCAFSCCMEFEYDSKHVYKHENVIACYVTIWAVYYPGRGEFRLDNVDVDLCTHIVFAFVQLNSTNEDLIISGTWTELIGHEYDNGINKLKERNKKLKVLASVGGWLDGSIKYSLMAEDPIRRKRFIENTMKFMRAYNLDGIDLFWQFPAKRGGKPLDKINYIELLKEFKEAFSADGYILTAAVGSSKDTIDISYDVPKLSMYLDYMFVLTLDYYGHWSRFTAPHSGLYRPNFPEASKFLNVNFTVSYLLKLGAEPRKLIMGVPTYGRNFLLNETADPKDFYYGRNFAGKGFAERYTEEDGLSAYNEICLDFANETGWSLFWDNATYTPFAVRENKLIVYEDKRSISYKIDYATRNNLGGIFAYAIVHDDFQGDCGDGKYPLLNAMHEELSIATNKIENDIVAGKSKNDAFSVQSSSILFILSYASVYL